MAAPKGNKYAIGNKGGRPPIFKTPKELAKKVDQYFIYIKGECHIEKKKVWNKEEKKVKTEDVKVWDRYSEHATITGLVLYLGFSCRSSMDEYLQREEFSAIIARAKSRVAQSYEEKLYGQFSQGAVFALKNMDGWKDKTEQEITGKDGGPVQFQSITGMEIK